jgi:hypothetical protein
LRRHSSISAATAAAAAVLALAAAPAGAVIGTGLKGPSTTVNPYVLPAAHGVQTTSLLTVGDLPAGNGYKMVGIPDGLGARTTAGKLDLTMNHELTAGAGVVRAHGQKGAFVSNYRIDKASLAVETGKDLIDSPSDISYWNYPAATYSASPSPASAPFLAQAAAFARFCSGTLTDPGQLLNASTGRGFAGQIYFGNEENGNEGRTFGILDDGTTKQLPRIGLFSYENTIPAHNTTDTTLVQGQEDSASGQIWAYTGTKTSTGDAFDRAGLTNGTSNVVDLLDEAVSSDAQFRTTYGKNVAVPFDLAPINWNQPGSAQNTDAAANGLSLNRIEDGHWDPDHPNDFYLLTTEGGNTTPNEAGITRDGGGLWRLHYTDIEQPQLGGTLTLLLDGSETPLFNKPDNMTIDTHGNILIQEDPGGNAHVARIVAYEIATGRRGVVATFDPALFAPVTPAGSDAPITTDEESSGIIDAKDTLGDGKFLFDAQVHKVIAPETDPSLVEMGQLLLLDIDDFEAVYSGQPTVADNPVGFWRMGEESGSVMFDSSGSDNDGTYLGGVVLGAPGVFANNTAATFDGLNDTARVPDSSSLDVGSSFTAECWIKRTSTTKTHELFNKGANGLQLVVMGTTGQVFLRKAGVTTIARSSLSVPAAGYHHIVATMDGPGSARIYIDGTQSTVSVAAVQAIQDTAFGLTFGSAGSTPAQYDEFALYDQALTATQVAAHHDLR